MDAFYSVAKLAILITVLVIVFGSATAAADWWEGFFSSVGAFVGRLSR